MKGTHVLIFAFINLLVPGLCRAKVDADQVVYETLVQRVPKQFGPIAKDSVHPLRSERNGVDDYLFKSENGKYVGDAFCNHSEVSHYVKNYSKPEYLCFRINVHEYDGKDDTINGLGRQVGIY